MKSRQTKQKEIITESVGELKGFFNADELFLRVQKKDESIGMATIYRNVKSLVDTNELHCYTCERRQVYSRTKQHCHFIDEDTGEVTHFEIDNLDFLKGKLPGSIESFQIEVKGRKKK